MAVNGVRAGAMDTVTGQLGAGTGTQASPSNKSTRVQFDGLA